MGLQRRHGVVHVALNHCLRGTFYVNSTGGVGQVLCQIYRLLQLLCLQTLQNCVVRLVTEGLGSRRHPQVLG